MSVFSDRVQAKADELVRIKFEHYKSRRRQQGLQVEYERFEDQPLSLQRSAYAQLEHMLSKVAALGYVVVSIDACDADARVSAFTSEEIERLAELEHERWVAERTIDGWTLGPRNHEAKTTPYLVPYSELSDAVKQYDRDAVDHLIEFLEMAGLAVARHKN